MSKKIGAISSMAAVVLCVICLSVVSCLATSFPVITTDELRNMIDEKKPFMLIDTRTKPEYQEAYIVGAQNIPETEFEKMSSLLIPDKKMLLVLYCSGITCGKTKRTAVKAHAMGYTNIFLYNEGFPVWEERGLKIVAGPVYEKKIETTKVRPEDLKQWIDSAKSDYVLVDVRDAAEFTEGRIPTAINIPAEQLAARSEALPKDKKVV